MIGDLTLATLRYAYQTLLTGGVTPVIMGGLALNRWRRFRLTDDVDLLIAVDPPAPDDLVRTMCEAGFFLRRVPPVSKIGDHRFVQFSYTPPGRLEDIAVDLLFADTDFQRSARSRAVSLGDLEGDFQPLVVSCEDLIILKMQADRILDRIDAVVTCSPKTGPPKMRVRV